MPSNAEKWWEVSVTKSMPLLQELLAETQVIGKCNVTSDYLGILKQILHCRLYFNYWSLSNT